MNTKPPNAQPRRQSPAPLLFLLPELAQPRCTFSPHASFWSFTSFPIRLEPLPDKALKPLKSRSRKGQKRPQKGQKRSPNRQQWPQNGQKTSQKGHEIRPFSSDLTPQLVNIQYTFPDKPLPRVYAPP
jgi:hypothetical protein